MRPILWSDYGTGFASSLVIWADPILIRLTQLTLLLGTSLICWRWMSEHRAAMRHALLFCSILAATLLSAMTLLGLKPDVLVNIPISELEKKKSNTEETLASSSLTGIATGSTIETEHLARRSPAHGDSVLPVQPPATDSTQSPSHQEHRISESDNQLNHVLGDGTASGVTAFLFPGGSKFVLGFVIWFLGAFVVVLVSLFRQRRLALLLKSSTPVGLSDLPPELLSLLILKRKVSVCESQETVMPLTTGALWPAILLPIDFRHWTPAQLRSVIAHEMAHVRRLDPLISLVAFVCCAILWFHPLMWMAYSRMRRESERAADDFAMRQGISSCDYAEHLISIVKRYGCGSSYSPGAATMASSSQLRTRILAVLNRKPEPTKGRLGRSVVVGMAIVCPLMAGSVRFEMVAAAQTLDANLVISPVPTTPQKPSYAENQRRLWEKGVANVLDSTKEIRDQVKMDLNVAWSPEKIESHTMTLHYWIRSMIHLGESEESEKLRDQALRSETSDLAKGMGAFSEYASQASKARGDFEPVLAPLRAGKFQYGGHHAFIAETIRQGDLATAERLVHELANSDRTLPNSGTYVRSSLMLLNAEIAIAAFRLGENARIEPALQRYRAELENPKTPSSRPLGESMKWLQLDPSFGLYFVNVLASSGNGALAELVWSDPSFESLFKDSNGKGPNQAAMHLCSRLAIAGESDIAIRIASQVFGNAVPAELYHWLCVRAARDKNSQALREYSDIFLRKVEALCLFDEMWTRQNLRPLSERAATYVKLAQAGNKLNQFVRAMSSPGSRQFATRGAELYVKMADRFVQEFERQTVADLRIVQEMSDYPFKLEPIVKALPESQLIEFSNRQDLFLSENSKLLGTRPYSGLSAGLMEERILALARIGIAPREEQVANWSFQMKRELITRLMDAGDKASASSLCVGLAKEVMKTSSLSYVSGSSGGRVINGATQNRYAAAELAVRFGDAKNGVEIIETIKHEGERVDGYRCLGREYAKSAGVEKAFGWAKSLSNDSFRLAACVGIVQAETERIMSKQPGELEPFIDELNWLGVPFILWAIGC